MQQTIIKDFPQQLNQQIQMSYYNSYVEQTNPQTSQETENFNKEDMFTSTNISDQLNPAKSNFPSYYQVLTPPNQILSFTKAENHGYDPVLVKQKNEYIPMYSSTPPSLDHHQKFKPYPAWGRATAQELGRIQSIGINTYGQVFSSDLSGIITQESNFSPAEISNVNSKHSQMQLQKKSYKSSGTRSFVQRVNHNMIERRRRDVINDCIRELDELIPPHKVDVKRHKGDVLKATIDYIKMNQKYFEQNSQEIDSTLSHKDITSRKKRMNNYFNIQINENIKHSIKPDSSYSDD